MRLERWTYDGKLFTGYVYDSPYFPDGDFITTSANFIDWKQKRILIGHIMIELGETKEDAARREEDELPW